MTRGVRRAAWAVLVPALGALASCGIPTTGVVEAGGPASGAVATIRVYYVADGALRGVARRVSGTVDAGAAVDVLLRGPTDAERTEGLRTLLPSVAYRPVAPLFSAAPTPDPSESAGAAKWVEVSTRQGRVDIRLTVSFGSKAALAAAQLRCTVVAAELVGDPGSNPLPVTVTGPHGQVVQGAGAPCPD